MMENFKKISLKTKIIIGACILLIVAGGIIFIKNNSNSPDKTMEKYKTYLIEGKYKEVVDLCYYPKNDYNTSKKVEELKNYYYKKMNSKSSDIVDCSYAVSKENDKYTTYKVILKTTKNVNNTKTEYINVRNEDNKIDNKDFYGKMKIKLYKDATLYVEGKKVTEKPKIKEIKNLDKNVKEEVFTLPLLKNVEYKFNGKHPIYVYENKTEIFTNFTDSLEWSKTFKKDFIKKLNSDVKEATNDIAKTVNDGGDLTTLNKYFKNKNAVEFCKDNDFTDKDYNWSNTQAINYEYKGIDDTDFRQRYYISKNKMYVTTRTKALYEETARKDYNGAVFIWADDGTLTDSYITPLYTSVSAIWECIDGKWVISSWEK